MAIVLDGDHRLIGTITDGDIRRTILAGVDLDLSVQVILDQRTSSPYPEPITAPVGTAKADLIRLMNEKSIRHIPIVNDRKCAVDLALQIDLVKDDTLPLQTVIMAGGYGKRLHPIAKKTPKPMLPIGQDPILGLIIQQLRKAWIYSGPRKLDQQIRCKIAA